MATLDRVMQMQSQGISDPQIIAQLQNEGISPTEINDSINQAKIKNAVSPPDVGATPSTQGMQASMMGDTPTQPMINDTKPQVGVPVVPAPEIYPPQGETPIAPAPTASAPVASAPIAPAPTATEPQYAPQDQYVAPAPEAYPSQAQYPQDAPQDDYYQQTPQAYSEQDYYGGSAGNTETISEIAEQVVTEKLNEYKKKVGNVATFKNNIQDKVNDIDDRLKRIEGTIDKLQQAIIGKIGEFGESNAMIHKDLENLHGTVGKLMNPLVDTYNELRKK